MDALNGYAVDYFNIDSRLLPNFARRNDGKGQFVNNLISYEDILKAAELYTDEKEFFDYLGSVAHQTLSDYGTKEYKEDYEYFHSAVDLTDCTKETMQALIEEAKSIEKPILSFVQPETKETEVLYKVLSALNIEDIDLTYEGGILVARDYDNIWSGKELYKFLIDEVFVFQDDGTILGIDDTLLNEFIVLCNENKVDFVDNRYSPLYRSYLSEKAGNSDKILLYQVGDFFEVFNDDAKTVVVLDSILNRITKNRAEGRETYIFIDEIYLLFQHEYSANFLFTLWKRVRKYGAYCTGITQNVDDLLQSHTARTMLSNSEFIIMLNEGSTDREDLANLLQISETQMTHITNVEVGHGLVKVGSALVPFERKFPKNTELYKLMTTKVGELN